MLAGLSDSRRIEMNKDRFKDRRERLHQALFNARGWEFDHPPQWRRNVTAREVDYER